MSPATTTKATDRSIAWVTRSSKACRPAVARGRARSASRAASPDRGLPRCRSAVWMKLKPVIEIPRARGAFGTDASPCWRTGLACRLLGRRQGRPQAAFVAGLWEVPDEPHRIGPIGALAVERRSRARVTAWRWRESRVMRGKSGSMNIAARPPARPGLTAAPDLPLRQAARGHAPFKIVSWNLLRRTGAAVDDVAALIAQEKPDLLLMQEAT